MPVFCNLCRTGWYWDKLSIHLIVWASCEHLVKGIVNYQINELLGLVRFVYRYLLGQFCVEKLEKIVCLLSVYVSPECLTSLYNVNMFDIDLKQRRSVLYKGLCFNDTSIFVVHCIFPCWVINKGGRHHLYGEWFVS